MQEGLAETQITAVDKYATDAQFSARQRLALTYADRITLSNEDVDERLFADLTDEFGSPEAIVELTALIAFENFRSKFNHALLVESNGVCLVRAAQDPPA